jgi:uncharacterized protein YndB with AHSA1/START domain
MHKTGESYSSARAQLVRARRPSASNGPIVSSSPRPATPAIDYAALAGMSDAAVKAKTGCDWAKWVWTLDNSGAESMSHRAIAQMVHDTWKVPEWWCQTVTVGYERIKGLRAIGQRRTGEYEASRSRTFAVPMARLFQAFASARTRNRWLGGAKPVVRKATPGKSIRMTWEDGTSVEIWFVSKGGSKSAAQVAHRKLKSKEEVEERKAYWGERFHALSEVLLQA